MFKYRKYKTKCVASIDGEMTIYTAAQLWEHFAGILDDSRILEIDLNQVSEIDSAGIQILMLARKSRTNRQQELKLVKQSSAVLDTFETLGLMPYFDGPLALPQASGE